MRISQSGETDSITACGTSTRSQSADSVREEVFAAFNSLKDATLHNDADALERIYADDDIFVTDRGTLNDKQKQVEAFRSRFMKYRALTPSEVNVRIFGPAMAVIVCRHLQSATVGGENRPGDVRVTNVWLKRNGRWQLVSGQVTPILQR